MRTTLKKFLTISLYWLLIINKIIIKTFCLMDNTGRLFLWHVLFKASYCFFQKWLTFIKLLWILVYTSNISCDCRFALIVNILNCYWILNGFFNNVVVWTKYSKYKIFASWKIQLLHLISSHQWHIINFLFAYSLSFFDIKFM